MGGKPTTFPLSCHYPDNKSLVSGVFSNTTGDVTSSTQAPNLPSDDGGLDSDLHQEVQEAQEAAQKAVQNALKKAKRKQRERNLNKALNCLNINA